MTKKNKEIQKALFALLKDMKQLEMLSTLLREECNIFDVLKVSQMEIRHSNFLAWLLNPIATGDIGKFLLQRLVVHILENIKEKESDFFMELLVDDFCDVNIQREWNNMDIVISRTKNDKSDFVICIENKVKSKQAENQLKSYREKINAEAKFSIAKKNKRIFFVFLRVNDEEPKDNAWIELTYQELGTFIEEALCSYKISSIKKIFIEQYISTLKRSNMMDDKQLLEIAQKIYDTHSTALEYIWDNVQNDDSKMFDYYKKWINYYKESLKKQKEKENEVYEFSQPSCVIFGTKKLYNAVFNGIGVNEEVTKKTCYYEIQRRNNGLIKLVFARNSNGLSNEIKNRLNEIGNKFGNERTDDWVFWTIDKKKIEIDDLLDKYQGKKLEQKIQEKIQKGFEKFENEILNKINKQTINQQKKAKLRKKV